MLLQPHPTPVLYFCWATYLNSCLRLLQIINVKVYDTVFTVCIVIFNLFHVTSTPGSAQSCCTLHLRMYVRTYVCTNVQVSVIESLRSRISELEYTNAKLTVELQNRCVCVCVCVCVRERERESNNSSAELRQTNYTQLHTR